MRSVVESLAPSPYFPVMVMRRFPRTVGSLEEICSFVQEFFAERAIDPEHAYNAELVIEELFTNMVKYGGGNDDIAIGLDADDARLTIELRDFGVERWDVTQSKPVDIERAHRARRPGGSGLHLVSTIAEDFATST